MAGERHHRGDRALGGDPAKGQKEAKFVLRIYDGRMPRTKNRNEKPNKDEKQKPGPKPLRGETAGFIGLRLTPTERAAYSEAAEAEDMTLSQWIRRACDEKLKRSKK